MNTEKNIIHIYEIFLYTILDDGLPGFHTIPKNNENLVSTCVTTTRERRISCAGRFYWHTIGSIVVLRKFYCYYFIDSEASWALQACSLSNSGLNARCINHYNRTTRNVVWQMNPVTLFHITKAVGRYLSTLIVEAVAAVNTHWMKSDCFYLGYCK